MSDEGHICLLWCFPYVKADNNSIYILVFYIYIILFFLLLFVGNILLSVNIVYQDYSLVVFLFLFVF